MKVLWSGKLLGDEDETPVRVVLDGEELHTERREPCSCGNSSRWLREGCPNFGTLKKALLAAYREAKG